MTERKQALQWYEVQKQAKGALDVWKKRNNQISFSSLSTLVDKDVDEQVFLNEYLSKELCEILEYWHDHRSLDQNRQDKFQKYSQYLLNFTKNNGEATQWLNQQTRLTDLAKKCADDIASHGYYLDIEGIEDPNLQSFDWLIQAYTNTECDQLIDIIVRCVSNRFYTKTLYNLGDVNASILTVTQQFLLITCPDYILTCDTDKFHFQNLLKHMAPHYGELFTHFLPNIEKWTDTVVLCLLYPIRFILSDLNALPLEEKCDIQEALVTMLQKQSLSDPNVEEERITLVDTAINILLDLVHSDPKILSELKKQASDDSKLLEVLRQFSNDNRNEKMQLHAYELLSLLVPEEEFVTTNDAAKVTELFVKIFNAALEEGKDRTAENLMLGLKVHSDDIKQEIVEQDALPSIIQYTKNAMNDPAPLEVAYALSFNADAKKALSEDRDFVDHVEKLRQSDNKKVADAAYGVIWKLEDEEKFIKEVEDKKLKEQSTEKPEEAADNKQKPEKAAGDQKKPKEAADDGKKTKEATADEKKPKEAADDGKKTKEEAGDEKKPKEATDDGKKTKEEAGDEGKPQQYDMMISYCWAQKELCHQINDRLEKDGYSVWLDRDEMRGSIVESMAEAVEDSRIILICMSSNYKMSTNCQAEAEYAFNRKSKIIPLKVEKDYTPDGWLGFMAGSKIYIDFADKEDEEFEKAYELLIAEIKRQDLDEAVTDEKEKSADTSSAEPKPEPVPEEIEPQPIQTREYLTMSSAMMWTKENVNEFLVDNELQPLVPICKSMDGVTLIEFHQHCQTLPTEMYSLVNKSKEEHPVTLDIFFRFICKMKQYLPPPKPPAKMFFQYHFIYENQ
ncbi:unnamed protein product [Rotaria sp. Silwood2]|nr:unnamed protein product [Rotaria sp. Silwood2]CAF4284412.1 unnamed protein product [Rotaria sp. Silwood2]